MRVRETRARAPPEAATSRRLRRKEGSPARPLGSVAPLDFRLTVRTRAALATVAERPGVNNRELSEVMGVADQGQISRLMARLREQALIENRGIGGQGAPKSWHLTREGEQVIQANPPLYPAHNKIVFSTKQQPLPNGPVGAPAGEGFRLTARTHLVLTVVAEQAGASNREIASASGVRDQGQISKLLARLENHGLLEKTGGQTQGVPNAWQLTPHGEEIVSLSPDRGADPSVMEEETCP